MAGPPEVDLEPVALSPPTLPEVRTIRENDPARVAVVNDIDGCFGGADDRIGGVLPGYDFPKPEPDEPDDRSRIPVIDSLCSSSIC
jgi:hypothetical protein